MRQILRQFIAPAFALGMALLQPAAAQEIDPGELVRGGLQAIQMIDQNRIGELWDGATAGARKRVSREDFTSQVAKARAPLGDAQQRTWIAINREVLSQGDADLDGQYANVVYETRFANKLPATMREFVSFHLDEDGVWRFSGYVLR